MPRRSPSAVPLAAAVLLALAALSAPVAASLAQEAPPAPRPCASAFHRQFDFWIGTWEVSTPDGKVAGTNRIEPILGGCALAEHWTGAGGLTGKSYNAYDASAKRWHQTWVDSQGTVLQLDGGLVRGAMVLSGTGVDSEGKPLAHRITWVPRHDGGVRQHWETSRDGGATWQTAFDGTYRPK